MDPNPQAAIDEVRLGPAEGGIPIGSVISGENRTFLGEEDLPRSRGVQVEVLQGPECIALMRGFIAGQPQLWNEDIGEEAH